MHFQFIKRQDLSSAIHAEIESFLDQQKNAHPFQFPSWAGELNGGEVSYCALVREGEAIRWFALGGVNFPAGKWLRCIRSFIVYRGPACDDPVITLFGLGKLLIKTRELGFTFLEIAPDWVEDPEWSVGTALSREGWDVLVDHRSSLRLDLTAGTEDLLRTFRKATRYEIKRSENNGVVVRPAQDERDLREFQRVYFEMAEKKGFPPVERDHLSHVLGWIVSQRDRGSLLLAFKGATLLGGTLVVRASTRSWYVFGATTKDERLSAGHLLQWHAIRWAKSHGCADYDFGGYREGVDTGPALFKRGFCQAVVHFAPTYRYQLNRRLCSTLRLLAKARSKLRGT